MKTDPTLASHNCTMPEHGRPEAESACCRPRPVTLPSRSNGANPGHPAGLKFWSDRGVWRIAARNTLNCLIGCMIGDLAVMLYMQAYHPQARMLLTMALATAAGLVTSILFESAMLRWREGFGWRAALTTAFSMSFLSMVGMELAANATDFMLTGGRVPFSDPFYWTALAISVGAGFLAPLPYNYWKFKRHGKACH